MTKRIRVLGLALAIVSAFSVVAAPGAFGQSFHSNSDTGFTYVTAFPIAGTVWDFADGANSKCTYTMKSSYAGTTASEITLTDVAYSGCTAVGQTADVDMMSCDYKLTSKNATTITTTLKCTNFGDSITITPTQGGIAICHIDIWPQSIDTSIVNKAGPPEGVELTPTGPFAYSSLRTPGGTKCPQTGDYTDGKMTGTTTLRAYQNANQTDAVNLTYN